MMMMYDVMVSEFKLVEQLPQPTIMGYVPSEAVGGPPGSLRAGDAP